MAKTLDFNLVSPITLTLVMRDDARTEITVSTPTEMLVEELQALAPELKNIMNANDAESIKAIYELAAKLISCNRNGLKVTAEELSGKYKLNLEALIVFYNVYLDLITEMINAKTDPPVLSTG